MISGKLDPWENSRNFTVIRPSKQAHLCLDLQVFVVDARELHEASEIKLPFEHWWSDAAAQLGLIDKVDYFQEGTYARNESDHSWTLHLKLYTAYAITHLMPRRNRILAERVTIRQTI